MDTSSTPRNNTFQCCCGESHCPHLAHANTLLEGLERDVQNAAKMGQALLHRHEDYMASAEQERRQMTATIQDLEREKLELEQQNAQKVKENRNLLDQLEELNNALANSDAQVTSLTEALHATQGELERITLLANRTEALERHLHELEKEQAQLHETLSDTVAEERTALQRWRNAEKTIGNLQDQIDKMEKEAIEEREKHVELIGRMERRRAVEAELQTAAGRLKGSAIAKTAAPDRSGTNVVSHFVNDILSQNTQLQMGIVELRELLYASNGEVERLRDQLQVHQPVSPVQQKATTPTLQKELDFETPLNREIHVHHHYHAPETAARDNARTKAPMHRVKKKRNVITAGHFTPPAAHSRQSSISRPTRSLSQNPILPARHRMSTQSNFSIASYAPSSVPDSPFSSSHRTSSIFDRVFSDSSRPTSPESGPGSPEFPSKQLQSALGALRPPSTTLRSTSMPVTVQAKSTPTIATSTELSPHALSDVDDLELSPSAHPTIVEENEDTAERDTLTSPSFSSDFDSDINYFPRQGRPGLHRALSHESLISLNGMDIHTLKCRPSQLLLPQSPRFSSSVASSQPVLSSTTATATRGSSHNPLDSSAYTRSLLYGSSASAKRGIRPQPSKETLGSKLGGWVFGKRTSSTSSSSDTLKPPSLSESSRPNSSKTTSSGGTSPSPSRAEFPREPQPLPIKMRAPGVNQSGPLLGFFSPVPEIPTQVQVTNFDAEALRESLREGEAS